MSALYCFTFLMNVRPLRVLELGKFEGVLLGFLLCMLGLPLWIKLCEVPCSLHFTFHVLILWVLESGYFDRMLLSIFLSLEVLPSNRVRVLQKVFRMFSCFLCGTLLLPLGTLDSFELGILLGLTVPFYELSVRYRILVLQKFLLQFHLLWVNFILRVVCTPWLKSISSVAIVCISLRRSHVNYR